jgi:hypothetical protein
MPAWAQLASFWTRLRVLTCTIRREDAVAVVAICCVKGTSVCAVTQCPGAIISHANACAGTTFQIHYAACVSALCTLCTSVSIRETDTGNCLL